MAATVDAHVLEVQDSRKQTHTPKSDCSEIELSEAFGNATTADEAQQPDSSSVNYSLHDGTENASKAVNGGENGNKPAVQQPKLIGRQSPVEMYDPAKHSPPVHSVSPKGKRLQHSNSTENRFDDLQWPVDDALRLVVSDQHDQVLSNFDREPSDIEKPRRNGNIIEMPIKTFRKMQLEMEQMRMELRLLSDRNAVLSGENTNLRSRLMDTLKRRSYVGVNGTSSSTNFSNLNSASISSVSGKSATTSMVSKPVERDSVASLKRHVVDVHSAHSAYALSEYARKATIDLQNESKFTFEIDPITTSAHSSRSTSPSSSSDEHDSYIRSNTTLHTLALSPSKSIASSKRTSTTQSSWSKPPYTGVPSTTSKRFGNERYSTYRYAESPTRMTTERDATSDWRARRKPFTPKHYSEVRVGDDVKFTHRGTVGHARVRYVGRVTGESRAFVGLDLGVHDDGDRDRSQNFSERELGDCDGTINGIRYFRTAPNRALFLPTDRILLVL